MTETFVDTRSALLDAFAQSADAPPAVIPAAALPAAETRNLGAQKVAVPRDEAKILQKIRVLASAAGQGWYYRFPVKNKDGSSAWIEGPSIKLTNEVARLFGNCDVDCRVFDTGDSLVFYARFTDIETGYTLTRPFQQRRNQKTLKTDSDRAADIVFQIGASKASRNVIVNALGTFVDFAFDEAKAALITRIGRDVEKWRARIITVLGELKIDVKRVERMVGRAVKDWLAPDIARISAEIQAVRDGMASADDTWPPLEQGDGAPTRADAEDTPKDGGAREPAKGRKQKAKDEPAKTAAAQAATAEPAAPGDESTPAAQDDAAAEDAAQVKSAGGAAPSTASTDEERWQDYRSDFITKLTACESGDAIGALLEAEHASLKALEKFDADGRNHLRELVAAHGKQLADAAKKGAAQ